MTIPQGKGAGTGTAAYNSAEEVTQAIATLNGSGRSVQSKVRRGREKWRKARKAGDMALF